MKALLTAMERWTLGRKLVLGSLITMVIVIGVGVFGVSSQLRLSRSMELLAGAGVRVALSIKGLQADYAVIGRALRQAILAADAPARQEALRQLEDARKRIRKTGAEIRPRLLKKENGELIDRFERLYVAYGVLVDRALSRLEQGREDEARALVGSAEFQHAGAAVEQLLVQGAEISDANLDAAAHDAVASAMASLWLFAALLVCGVAVALGASRLIGRSIRLPLFRLRDSVAEMAQGNLDRSLPFADYPNEFGELSRAIGVLQAEARRMGAQRWIKTNQAAIQAELQTAESLPVLARNFLAAIAPLLNVGRGVFYVWEEEERHLRLLGSYAHLERKSVHQTFRLGQGVVGQCALERQPIVITDPPEDYVHIGSALGEAPPRVIAALPVLHNARLMAVVELAAFDRFGPDQEALLEGILPALAMTMEILGRTVKTRDLLDETRRQAESMEKQAARLEEQAVELEAQQTEIRATEAWYRGIIEAAPDGMLVIDDRGMIILINPQAEAMFGHGSGELTGRPVEPLIPALMRQDYGTRQGHRLQGVRRDDTVFPLVAGLSRLPTIGGHGGCICVSLREIVVGEVPAPEPWPGAAPPLPEPIAPAPEPAPETKPAPEAMPAARSADALPDLPGIDVKAGLATMANKLSLYTRMLIKFREGQGRFAELFAAAQADSDPSAATRAAHTLKGTAGNIGAKGLQAAAAALEHACKEGGPQDEIEVLLSNTLAELEPVMAGLRRLEGAEPSTAPAISDAEVWVALGKLAALLEDSDSEAGDLLEGLLPKLAGTALATALQPVAKAIDDCDLDEALVQLGKVKVP
ncbi:GAF domain-containing protein [Paramagnetospirillum magneticum]|uniref:Methyl-accepting chemotaxis protein n=1 Tax=Paramagnetospirillum magneticum (strain ATCC 700264 / AMB-1) TaxID=342108 RepID=Q2W338_PARM1|nr:GAF domain-containing protein [Paramagnetospirillum magneticum]BAE51737.1 hypothetical protein amb2933 [Paramagnetospirillum magneticum AMB-1]